MFKKISFDAQGCSEFQVIKSSAGWFVGYYKQADDGNVEIMRMSGVFPCYDHADAELRIVRLHQQAT